MISSDDSVSDSSEPNLLNTAIETSTFSIDEQHTEDLIKMSRVDNEVLETLNQVNKESKVILEIVDKNTMMDNEDSMQYEILLNAKKQTLASIAAFTYKIGLSANDTIRDINKVLNSSKKNEETDADHTLRILESIKQIITPKLDACKSSLTTESLCEPLAKWLKKPKKEKNREESEDSKPEINKMTPNQRLNKPHSRC